MRIRPDPNDCLLVNDCQPVWPDILLAVKNNNVNKIPNYDPSHFEHLKKTMKGYLRLVQELTTVDGQVLNCNNIFTDNY